MYETKDDLKNEEEVKKFLINKWKVNIYKLPLSYKMDFCLEKGKKIVAFAEIKNRTTPYDRYPTYILSLAKVVASRQLANETRTQPLLIVNWTDQIRWINLKEDFNCTIGGRKDRNDWQDIEPLCEFDINKFNLINRVLNNND